MGLLYGRAGRLAAENGGFRRGQDAPKNYKLPKRSRQHACELLKRWGVTYMEGAVPPRTVAKLNGTFERVYARLEARATELGHDGIDDEVRYTGMDSSSQRLGLQ